MQLKGEYYIGDKSWFKINNTVLSVILAKDSFLSIVHSTIMSDIEKKEDGKKIKKVQPTLFTLGNDFEVPQMKRKPDGRK